MKFAIIENGVVVNVAASEAALGDNWIESDTAQIGDTYENGEFITPEPDPTFAIEANVARAKAALVESDWSDLPSVRNVAIEPHLLNGAEFDTYRAGLRAIVVSRPADVETWPVRPDAVWS